MTFFYTANTYLVDGERRAYNVKSVDHHGHL